MRHRLRADNPEPLAVGGTRDDRSPFEERAELVVGHEPARFGNLVAQRAVPCDDQRDPARSCRLDELENPFLRRQPSGEEDLRRIGLFSDLRG